MIGAPSDSLVLMALRWPSNWTFVWVIIGLALFFGVPRMFFIMLELGYGGRQIGFCFSLNFALWGLIYVGARSLQ